MKLYDFTNYWEAGRPARIVGEMAILRQLILGISRQLIPRCWGSPILLHPVHHFFDHLVSRDVV